MAEGFTVPTLNRISPADTSNADRLNVRVPDNTEAVAQQGQAVENVTKSIGDYITTQQNYAADTAGKYAAVEYYQDKNNRFDGKDGIKYKQGDLDPLYKDYQDKSDLKKQEILARYKDADPRTQAEVKRNLQDVDAKFYDRETTWYGKASNEHEQKTTDDTVAMQKLDLVHQAGLIDPKNPNTFQPFEQTLKEMSDARHISGLKNGTVQRTTDSDGNVVYKYDPSVRLQMAKDASDGIFKAISNVAATGHTDIAQVMSDKYSTQLDEVNKPLLKEKIAKQEFQNQSMLEFSKIKSLPAAEQISSIDNIKGSAGQSEGDVEKLRENVLSLVNSHTLKVDNIKRRASKDNYNDLFNYVNNRQQSGNPFVDVTAMNNDDYVKSVMDQKLITDPKQILSLQHMIQAPKDSNQEIKNNAFDKLFNGDFKGMEPADFNQVVAGLNPTDRNMFQRKYTDANTESKSEENQNIKFMGTQLTREMQDAKIIKKDARGHWSNKDEIKINEARSEMMSYADKFPANTSNKDRSAWIKTYVADHLVNEGDVPQAPLGKVFGGTIKKPDTSSVPGTSNGTFNLQQKQKASVEYYKANKNTWPSPDQLTQFMQGKSW